MTGFQRCYDEDEMARQYPPRPLNPRTVAKIQELRDAERRANARLEPRRSRKVSGTGEDRK